MALKGSAEVSRERHERHDYRAMIYNGRQASGLQVHLIASDQKPNVVSKHHPLDQYSLEYQY